jgi:AbiV family abortive infection protein
MSVKKVSNVSKMDCARGASLCRHNALRYYDDAKNLFESKSYGHSFLLGTYCLEELGKSFILLSLRDEIIPRSLHSIFWKIAFRDHTFKNMIATMALLGLYDLPHILSTVEVKQRTLEWALGLDKLRQRSQFVGYTQDWQSPLDSEFEGLAEKMLAILPIFLNLAPAPREERLRRIQETLSDPEKVRELEAILPTVLPALRRMGKRLRLPTKPSTT